MAALPVDLLNERNRQLRDRVQQLSQRVDGLQESLYNEQRCLVELQRSRRLVDGSLRTFDRMCHEATRQRVAAEELTKNLTSDVERLRNEVSWSSGQAAERSQRVEKSMATLRQIERQLSVREESSLALERQAVHVIGSSRSTQAEVSEYETKSTAGTRAIHQMMMLREALFTEISSLQVEATALSNELLHAMQETQRVRDGIGDVKEENQRTRVVAETVHCMEAESSARMKEAGRVLENLRETLRCRQQDITEQNRLLTESRDALKSTAVAARSARSAYDALSSELKARRSEFLSTKQLLRDMKTQLIVIARGNAARLREVGVRAAVLQQAKCASQVMAERRHAAQEALHAVQLLVSRDHSGSSCGDWNIISGDVSQLSISNLATYYDTALAVIERRLIEHKHLLNTAVETMAQVGAESAELAVRLSTKQKVLRDTVGSQKRVAEAHRAAVSAARDAGECSDAARHRVAAVRQVSQQTLAAERDRLAKEVGMLRLSLEMAEHAGRTLMRFVSTLTNHYRSIHRCEEQRLKHLDDLQENHRLLQAEIDALHSCARRNSAEVAEAQRRFDEAHRRVTLLAEAAGSAQTGVDAETAAKNASLLLAHSEEAQEEAYIEKHRRLARSDDAALQRLRRRRAEVQARVELLRSRCDTVCERVACRSGLENGSVGGSESGEWGILSIHAKAILRRSEQREVLQAHGCELEARAVLLENEMNVVRKMSDRLRGGSRSRMSFVAPLRQLSNSRRLPLPPPLTPTPPWLTARVKRKKTHA